MTSDAATGPGAPDGLVVQARLAVLSDRLTACDSRIRRHDPEGVHQMRVTLRRLRSVLATFSPLFDTRTVAELRAELSWLAGELGSARDHDVIHARLAALAVGSDERALVEKISEEIAAAGTAALERSVLALDSTRYSDLRRAMTEFTSGPPWEPSGSTRADALHQLVLRDWRRLARRVKDVDADVQPPPAVLHDVRKSTKRLRYSAETLAPLSGKDAKRLARGAKRVQVELGELQDSAVTQAVLRDLVETPGRTPEELFILGGLGAQERLLSAQAEARWQVAWQKLARTRNRRWLT